jgi:RNA recognition motif-containing protein
MKNLENACGYYQRYYQRPHADNDPNKPQLYWDGYQWVIRPNSFTEQSLDIIKPGRKVQISNVPLHLNIQPYDFREYIIKKSIEKDIISQNDVNHIKNLIRGIELDFENNAAVVEMESVDYAKRMVLLDGLILLGHTLRVSLYQDINSKDSGCSNVIKAAALANSAHMAAKATAIAFAALKSLGNKAENAPVTIQSSEITNVVPSSRIVKVMNLVDPKEAKDSKFPKEKFEETLDDISDEFSKFGNIVSSHIIKPKNEKIGAETGSVFMEFQEQRSAENCIKTMKGKRYEGRDVKVAFIDENVFKKEIL